MPESFPRRDEIRPLAAFAADDLATVRGALTGDARCVERFIDRMRCIAVIVNGLNGRMGRPLDEHEVADVVQDTLLVAWRKLESYTGAGALEFWVYRIGYLEFMNGLRRRARQPRLGAEAFAELATPGATPFGDDVRLALHEGLDELGPPSCDVIRLKHYDRMTFDEIGAALRVSPNTAKAHYYRGIERLRDILVRREGVGVR